MGKIIGIQFQENGKMYYFDSADVQHGDMISAKWLWEQGRLTRKTGAHR